MKLFIALCIRRRNRGHGRFWNGETIVPVPPESPTYFELELDRLGLAGESYEALRYSRELFRWAGEHRLKHYIPEVLLNAWGIAPEEREISFGA